MKKEDNTWEILTSDFDTRSVEINDTFYKVDDNTACLAHAILLLVDAINDKQVK